MDDAAEVQCPYCFEWVEVYVDPETRGATVEDCEVCCRPWLLVVERDEAGELRVSVSRAQ